VSSTVPRLAQADCAQSADFAFGNTRWPPHLTTAQRCHGIAGKGGCGSERQKAATALAALSPFSLPAGQPVAPAIRTSSSAGLFFGSSRARDFEKPGRFSQHLRTCSCDRRKALRTSDFRKSLMHQTGNPARFQAARHRFEKAQGVRCLRQKEHLGRFKNGAASAYVGSRIDRVFYAGRRTQRKRWGLCLKEEQVRRSQKLGKFGRSQRGQNSTLDDSLLPRVETAAGADYPEELRRYRRQHHMTTRAR